MKQSNSKKTTGAKVTADKAFSNRSTLTTSKSTRKKTSGSKSTKARTSKSVNTSASQKTSFMQSIPMEVRLIILLFVCLALFLSIYFDNFGVIGTFTKKILSGLIGSVSYTVPFYLLTITIHLFLKKTLSPHKHRYVFVALALIFLGAIHTLSNPVLFEINNSNFSALWETHKNAGQEFSSGGTIGALIALPLKALVSDVGAYIILVFLTLISFVTATGTEPITNFFRFVAEKTVDFAEKVKEDRDASLNTKEEIPVSGIDADIPETK